MNIHKKVQDNIPQLKGHYTFTLRDVYTGEVEIHEYDNIVTRDAWIMIANNFGNAVPDNVMAINKIALGTGTNTPTIEDHDLQTETYRNNVFSKSNTSNIVDVTAYFTQTEVSGTFREAGMFSNATATANSGILVSHVAINVTKTLAQTLTIDFKLTIGT